MDLQEIMLSAKSQFQKVTFCMIHVYNIPKIFFKKYRDEEQINSYQGLGMLGGGGGCDYRSVT